MTCSCVECWRRDEELKSFTKAPDVEVNTEKIERHLSGSSTQREQHSKQKQLTRQAAQKREEVERQQKDNGSVEGDEERRQERGMKKEGQVEKEQGREEREKGRKGLRGRGQEGRKKEERGAEEGGAESVEKDVTGWTEVTRKKKKMVQIFVKVDGSGASVRR